MLYRDVSKIQTKYHMNKSPQRLNKRSIHGTSDTKRSSRSVLYRWCPVSNIFFFILLGIVKIKLPDFRDITVVGDYNTMVTVASI